jgi:putative DNA primase/helicase
MQTNFKPVFDVEDQAAVDRVKMIPFTARFTRRPQGSEKQVDTEFVQALMHEHLDEVFTWLVHGAMRWYADRSLAPPAFAQAQMRAYVNDLDVVTRFVAEQCDVGDGETQRRSEMYAAYKRWCQQEDESVKTASRFIAAMKTRRFQSTKVNGIDTWRGIASKD